MTLLSYISIPYTSQSNETNYIRIDLMTNKVFVKDNEVLNIEECKKEVDEAFKKNLSNLIFRSKSETDNDIAQVVHFMFKHDYVCASIKNNIWYEFKNNQWVVCESGYGLRGKITTDVSNEYLNHAGFWNQKGSTEYDESEQQRCAEIGKKLNGIANKLKQGSFIDNIMKECKYLFYVEKFEERFAKDNDEHDCIDCCDHDHDNDDYHDHDSDCCINDQKDELIALLKNELETEEEKGDNKDYILELKVTLERLQM